MRLTQIIEALLFASDAPLTASDLARVDERLDEDTVEAVIQELRSEYETTERSFQVYELAGGYQLLTRPEFVTVLERYESVPQPSRLSNSALEVLAIIAYRQPLGRAEVEEIRGVGSSGVLRTLQDRHLIEAVGRAEGLGRPLLYGTTAKFLEHFGYRSLEDLPRPDELPVVLLSRDPIVIAADPAEGTSAQVAHEQAPAPATADEGTAGDDGDGNAETADERAESREERAESREERAEAREEAFVEEIVHDAEGDVDDADGIADVDDITVDA